MIMTVTCPLCDAEYAIGDLKKFTYRVGKKSRDIYVCGTCFTFLGERERIVGRLVVDRCKECGRVKSAKFQPYKKKGRQKGSRNKPKPKPQIAQPLDAFAGPITEDKNFQQFAKKEGT
jgi:DNA-directed RNA polymerase subunit N (RpoN/RPB10)